MPYPTSRLTRAFAVLLLATATAPGATDSLDAARAALAGPWGKMSARERGRLVSRLADRLMERADEVARLETMHNGKPIGESRHIEIPAAAECFEYFAGWADKVMGVFFQDTATPHIYTPSHPLAPPHHLPSSLHAARGRLHGRCRGRHYAERHGARRT